MHEKLNLSVDDSFQMIFSKNLEARAIIRKFTIVGLFDS